MSNPKLEEKRRIAKEIFHSIPVRCVIKYNMYEVAVCFGYKPGRRHWADDPKLAKIHDELVAKYGHVVDCCADSSGGIGDEEMRVFTE